MKNVGILTYHYINNYGALLQTYALKKAIDKIEGFSADVINYIPDNFGKSPDFTAIIYLKSRRLK